ncbi:MULTISPECIES: hypothetical protein [Streptomyces]|uniref:hypothetical protein n=1 Tax=Streptomyces TaxID=1883 RepID=UPI0004CC5552|nr:MULTISPECIES: hypothetical protein [Streptomyces]
MSAISLILLCAAATATALGGAALHTARGLRRQLTQLRTQLHELSAERAGQTSAVPHARDGRTEPAAAEPAGGRPASGPFAEEIRAAVAAALADERERELAEARAFWAAQEARDTGPGSGSLLAGHGTEYEIVDSELSDFADSLDALGDGEEWPAPGDTGEVFIPRQAGPDERDIDVPESFLETLESLESLESLGSPEPPESGEPSGAVPPCRSGPHAEAPGEPGADDPAHAPAEEPTSPRGRDEDGPEEESAELAAARRRHPSQPDFTLSGEPVVPGHAPSHAPTVADHERTVERLAELADARTPLADVRPGPLGTLDVYVFEDGTTVCLSPGHRATSEALADALRLGDPPVLLGGSGVAGSYALTFGFADGRTAYLLADRVITSV